MLPMQVKHEAQRALHALKRYFVAERAGVMQFQLHRDKVDLPSFCDSKEQMPALQPKRYGDQNSATLDATEFRATIIPG
jgi:hypothetical protein